MTKFTSQEIGELSRTLNAPGRTVDTRLADFRNSNGVYMKCVN